MKPNQWFPGADLGLPDAERFRLWLSGLPRDRPGSAAQALIDELQRFRAAGSRQRSALLEAARETVLDLVREVERKLAVSPLPLEQELQLEFLAANALLKTVAAGHAGIAQEYRRKWIGIGHAKSVRLAVVQAMQFQAQRLVLAYRVYARGSKSAWSELHRLYRSARSGGFAGQIPPGTAASPERIYLDALLLDFAEPTKLAPGELEQVRLYIERHAALAEIEDAQAAARCPTNARFLLKAGETGAGRSLIRAGKTPIEEGDLVLNCNRLVARIKEQIGALESGIDPAHLGLPQAGNPPQCIELLGNLLRLWSATPKRRFSRQKFRPRVDLVVGLDSLWSYLAGPANRRRTDTLPVKVDTSEWSIGNESPGGFSLQYIAGNAAPVGVGEIVGLRPRELNAVYICLTRRVVTGDLQSLELGLQKLAPGGISTTIPLETEDGFGRRQARAVRVIVLPRLPSAGNGPAIIAPAQTLQPGVPVHLQQRGGTLRMRVDRLLDRSHGCEIFALTPSTGTLRTPRPPDAPAAAEGAAFPG